MGSGFQGEASRGTDQFDRLMDGLDTRIAKFLGLLAHAKAGGFVGRKGDLRQIAQIATSIQHFFSGAPSSVDNKDDQIFFAGK